MTTVADLVLVGVFAIGLPVYDHFVFWPAFRRRTKEDPARARMWLWRFTIASLWLLVAIGAVLWLTYDRSWASLGFRMPGGWRWWTSAAVVMVLAVYQVLAAVSVARNTEARTAAERQLQPLAATLPHTRTELWWFAAVSITAGFCEEFLYRGFFIGVFSPWIGWWGAAALSLPFFAIAHVYQGWNGVLRTGIMGALFTLLVAVFDSLWPAIALHALIDLGSGTIAWLALRKGPDRTASERASENT